MTRTFADMTPAERDDCVGMWATYHGSTNPNPVIIWAVEGDMVWRLSHTSRHAIMGTDLDQITPRFDLPRAWNPDGTPVEMTQEHGAGWIEKDREPMHWPIPVDDCSVCETATPTHRRFVTDWEEA